MTIFGKLLVFLNLVFSIATGALIVFVFTTRANWVSAYNHAANQAKAAEAAYKAEKAAHENDIKQKDASAKELEAHQHRRKRLDAHPVTAHFLVYEPVLNTCLSVSQLAHLLRRSEQPHVTIQIVPRQERPVGILHDSFTTLSFPDKDEPDLVHTTTTIGPSHTQDAQAVATANAVTGDAGAHRADDRSPKRAGNGDSER